MAAVHHPRRPPTAAIDGGLGPAGGFVIARVNPLQHGPAIKQLFLAHERPEFPAYFDRAYPDAVAEGGTSWVAWDQDGRMCAHIAQFHRELAFGARRLRAALLANLLVASTHRTFWPALALVRRAISDLAAAGCADLVYADPNERALPLLRAAGLRAIGGLRRFVLPLTDRRRGVALGLRFYHCLGHLRATPLIAIARSVGDAAAYLDPQPAGDWPSLRPVRRASLYRGRLAGYPSAADQWYTFHEPRPPFPLVGKALVRASQPAGTGVVCVLECEPITRASSVLVALARSLRAAGMARLEIWVMADSPVARAVRRAGFVPRPERAPVLARPLTQPGIEAMDAGGAWRLSTVDLDR